MRSRPWRFPYEPRRRAADDLGRRPLAKYRLLGGTSGFRDAEFPPVPRGALLPERDPFGGRLERLFEGPLPVA